MVHILIHHLGTMVVTLLLIAVVVAIVWKLIKDKKQGKSSCGCHCAHCGMAGACHADVKGEPHQKPHGDQG